MERCCKLYHSAEKGVHAYLVQCAKRSNNNPVNDMTAPVSGLINDLYKVMKTMSSQSLFG